MNEKLEKWYLSMNISEELEYHEAKTLYLEALNTKDSNKKNELLNKVIKGTLYVVYNFLKENYINCLDGSCDFEDIISEITSKWIEFIYNDGLLKRNGLTQFLNSTALLAAIHKQNPYIKTLPISESMYLDLYEYITYRKKQDSGIKLSDDEKTLLKCTITRFDEANNYKNTFENIKPELFKNIYNKLKESNCLDLSEEKLKKILRILSCDVLKDQLLYNTSSFNIESDIHDTIVYDKLLEYGLQCLDDRRKEALLMYYGLTDGKCYTCIEIGKRFNVTPTRVSQLVNQAERIIRDNIISKCNKNKEYGYVISDFSSARYTYVLEKCEKLTNEIFSR